MPSHNRLQKLLAHQGPRQESGGWLLSYLDVMTLLLTLFVLLLTLARSNKNVETSDSQPIQPPVIRPLHDGLLPQHNGLLPKYDGLQQSFQALALDGVEASRGTEGMTLRIADHLLFASGQAELTAQGEAVIRKLQPILKGFEGEISVEGHSDNIPIHTRRFASNWELSTGRAISVLRFLEAEQIDSHRLRAIGYAATRPLASNVTPEGRAANRRVELILRQP